MFARRGLRTLVGLLRNSPSCSHNYVHNASQSVAAKLGNLTEAELKVTKRAVSRLKEILDTGERLRVEVDGGGCSGFEYKIRLDNKLNAGDRVWAGDEVEVVVDQMSLGYLKGATIDFVEDLMKSSFRVVNNPVAEKGCSCGSSFALKMD